MYGFDRTNRANPSVPDSDILVPPLDEEWTADLPGNLWLCYPVVESRTVYCTTSRGVVPVDLDDGAVDEVFADPARVTSNPAVVDGRIYVGSDDGALYSLNPDVGYDDFHLGGNIYSSPLVLPDVGVYVGSTTGDVYGLRFEDRSWQFETGGEVLSSPASDGDVIYVGSNDGFLYALDAAAGTERWRVALDTSISASPCIVDGSIVVPDDEGTVYSVAKANGRIEWRTATSSRASPSNTLPSSPAAADGTVFVGSVDGTVTALDAADGSVVWQTDTDDGVLADPVVVDGHIYVGDRSGGLYAFSAESGAIVWQEQVSGETAGLAVVSSRLLVTTDDDTLYAFSGVIAASEERIETLQSELADVEFDAPPARRKFERAQDRHRVGRYHDAATAAQRGLDALAARRQIQRASERTSLERHTRAVANVLGYERDLEDAREAYDRGDYERAEELADTARTKSWIGVAATGAGGLFGVGAGLVLLPVVIASGATAASTTVHGGRRFVAFVETKSVQAVRLLGRVRGWLRILGEAVLRALVTGIDLTAAFASRAARKAWGLFSYLFLLRPR